VVRIKAEPAKNPSFWTRSTRIEHRYVKVNDFWLPAHNRSLTSVRLGGSPILGFPRRKVKATNWSANPIKRYVMSCIEQTASAEVGNVAVIARFFGKEQ
jgi:hypothetical protein